MDEKIVSTPNGDAIAPEFPGTLRTAKCRDLLTKEALQRITLEKELDRIHGPGTAQRLIDNTPTAHSEHYRHNVEQMYRQASEETALDLLAKTWSVISRLLVGRSRTELECLGLGDLDDLRRNIAHALLLSGIVQGEKIVAEYHHCQPGNMHPNVLWLDSGKRACEITDRGEVMFANGLTLEEYQKIIRALLKERDQAAHRAEVILRFYQESSNVRHR